MIGKIEKKTTSTEIENKMKTVADQGELKFRKVNDNRFWVQDKNREFAIIYRDGDIQLRYKYEREDEYVIAIDDLFLLPAERVRRLCWRLHTHGFHIYLRGEDFSLSYYPRTKTLEISPRMGKSHVTIRYKNNPSDDLHPLLGSRIQAGY